MKWASTKPWTMGFLTGIFVCEMVIGLAKVVH